MKIILSFLCGLVLGVSLFLFSPTRKNRSTSLEKSLAQIIYQKMDRYQNEVDLDRVFSLVKEFTANRLPLKDEKELYEPILEVDEKIAVEEAKAAEKIAEDYLVSIQDNPRIISVVPKRVLYEVLEEGKGGAITAQDPVRVIFKEYGVDGSVLKDSINPYTIPLWETIRGFQLAMQGAKVGEKRKIYVHPEYGFGKMGRKAPNKLLIYEVTILGKV